MDPFRVRISPEFDWQIPPELQSRVELVRPSPVGDGESPLSERLERAIHDSNLDVNLTQLVTPGDRVALAVDPHTPSLKPVLLQILGDLARLQVSMGESCVVFPAHATAVAGSIRSMLDREESLRDVQVISHDAVDRSALAYLAANVEGEPIYIARALADADVAIPIFAASSDNGRGAGAAARFIYGHFGGSLPTHHDGGKKTESRKKETSHFDRDANEAFWQLGSLFGIVISAGSGGQAGRIVAGSAAQLDQGIFASKQDWECPIVPAAPLVIAEVSGDIDQQHWGAAAHALNLARELSTPEGMIVVVSDIAAGTMSRKAIRAAQRTPTDSTTEDIRAFAASLNPSSDANPLFLRSQLSEEATEDLGMGFVSKPSELNRLIERQSRCILIRDAQHVHLTLEAYASPRHS